MDAMNVLENSYYIINKNFGFYKRNYGHIYYLNVQDDETKFIDKMFGKVENELSAQDKMLNYSISAIYTATAVLIEILNRNRIEFNEKQIEKICVGFSNMNNNEISFADKTEEELDEILFGLLTDGIDLESRKKSGSERTPDEIIKYMLDIIGYDEAVSYARTIIDPACGTGTFIKQIIERFIDGLYVNEITGAYKEKLLEHKLIRAYDTKPSNVFVTKIVMISSLIKRNLIREMNDVLDLVRKLPIYCQDFLCMGDKSDYIIGNPPYIRLQNLSIEYRDFIKDNFVSATGRFDIFTCFLEKSDKLLNENGMMCLITSNKYLTANYGVGIREYLSKTGHVRKLVDLYDTKFFGAAVLPAIIMCENSKRDNCVVDYIGIKTAEQDVQHECQNANELFEYVENVVTCGKRFVLYGKADKQVFEVSRSKVKISADGETWNFSTSDENTIKTKMDELKLCSLADIFDVCVGIKTTADTVFVKPMTKNFIDEHAFEDITIYPLIQSFNVSKWNISWGSNSKDRYILYPHREMDGNMVAIPLEEIPKTAEYVSHNSFALDESGRLCQGNTFFLTRKNSVLASEYLDLNTHQYYCFVLGVLNSKAMEYYQKMISGCLYSQKYRYTTSNLNRWPIPRIKKEDAIVIASYVDDLLAGTSGELENAIDKIVYDAFELSEEEILQIESFIGKGRGENC